LLLETGMEELRQALSHDPAAQLVVAEALVVAALIFYGFAT